MPLLQQPVAVSIQNILLATDFSIAAKRAAAYAIGVAHRFRSRIEVAHVFDPSVVTSYEEAIVPANAIDRKKISDENLHSFVDNLHLEGIPTTILATEGHRPSQALLDIASEHQIDLIVAGTEAKDGLARLILGSTAEKILRGATCPVLTVGPNAAVPKAGPIEFRTIIYATDFSAEAARAATIALSFAQDSAARLYCCCVLSLDDEGLKTRDELQQGFSRRLNEMIPESSYDWCEPECIVEYGDAAERILELAGRVNADLIVLGARRASFWLTRVDGGLTGSLLAQAKCPVLTLC